MTTQPQNNDLRRKAEEFVTEKLPVKTGENLVYASPEDVADTMLEFLQEQGQREECDRIYKRLDEIGKKFFYAGFNKSEKDDANCFTAWREEAGSLISEALNSLKENK